MKINLDDIRAAQKRIDDFVLKTPLIESEGLQAASGGKIHLKLENLQSTGSFKLRGATNKIMSLTNEEKERGVVTVSSGNHGRAVSYVAGKIGMMATVCVSEFVPEHKIEVIHSLGGTVKVAGPDYEAADAYARKLARASGLTWIDAFDDPAVIAGQGTIGLEIMEDLPDVDMAIVPTSGGGLISGIALALKLTDPDIKVIGVTMERGPAMYLSLQAGNLVPVVEEETLADALMGGLGEENRYTFGICKKYVDEIVLVSEGSIARAMAYAFHEHRLVVEGGGAVGIAALLGGKIEAGENTVVVISGGNVQPEVLLKVVEEYPRQ